MEGDENTEVSFNIWSFALPHPFGTYISFASPYRPQGSEDDQEYKCFTLNTYQETFCDMIAKTGVTLGLRQKDGNTEG